MVYLDWKTFKFNGTFECRARVLWTNFMELLSERVDDDQILIFFLGEISL